MANSFNSWITYWETAGPARKNGAQAGPARRSGTQAGPARRSGAQDGPARSGGNLAVLIHNRGDFGILRGQSLSGLVAALL